MMRIWMLGLLVSLFAATGGVAQLIDEVAPMMEGEATSLSVRTPGTRAVPDIAADAIQLPATAALAPGAGFNVAGYVEAAPPELLADARWQMAADGRSVYAVEFFSENAESLRVKFDPEFDERISVYVYAPLTGSTFGPYSKHQLARAEWWSTIIFGDSIGLEFVVAGGADPPAMPIIASVAYGTEPPRPPDATQGGCQHRDVSCEPAWANPANSVALLATLNQNGNLVTFCSGALLSRQPGDLSPLVMTANHCVPVAGSAAATVFVWFFQTASCNGAAPDPNDLPRSEGSLVVKRHTGTDWSLLGLFEPPPANWYLGWDSGFWSNNSSATGIHHPAGTFKRISLGTKEGRTNNQRFCDDDGNCFSADVWDIEWTTGWTQGGSSGSPVMSGGGIVRGTLTGGPEDDCTISLYGRFDRAYENLRYYLGNAYIASPVYVNRGARGDSGNNGDSERGTSGSPFNTVYEATFAVRASDEVRIRSANYNERFTLWRPMTLNATGGVVRIGAP